MRWALVLPVSLVALGCAGGQTGEITQLTLCERVVETLPIADLPQDTRALLDGAVAGRQAELRWEDDGTTTQLELQTELAGEMADRIGPGDCAKVVRVPASVHLATRDQRLDLVVDVLIDLAEADRVVTFHGSAAATSINGRDQLEDVVEVSLWMEQQSGGDSTAMLSFDGAPAAAF